MTDRTTLTLRVNGEEHTVVFPTHHTLLEVLREECGLTGTKHGCELGECGTCTVLHRTADLGVGVGMRVILRVQTTER